MYRLLAAMAALLLLQGASTPTVKNETLTLHGWISDSVCARGRAQAGMFTGTSPACTRKCLASGGHPVLVDPTGKAVFGIENEASVTPYAGDLVEVGAQRMSGDTIHVLGVKLIEKGREACMRPKSAPQQ